MRELTNQVSVTARYAQQRPNGLSHFISFHPYLIRLTYGSHTVPMLLFSFHIMPHALLISFISVQCKAMLFPSILSLPCGCLMLYFLSISWLCLMHTSTSCHQSPEYSRTVISRSATNMYKYMQQHIRAQVPARELQFSSLGFSPLQPVRSPPQPLASAFSAYFLLRFPRVPVDAGYHWVVSAHVNTQRQMYCLPNIAWSHLMLCCW